MSTPSKRPSKDILRKEFNEHTRKELAIIYGVTEDAIRAWLEFYKMPPKKCACGCGEFSVRYSNIIRSHIVNCKIYDIPSKEDLEYMYNERLFSLNQLSKIMGTSIPTLKKWMKSYGLETRSKSMNISIIKSQNEISRNSKYYFPPLKSDIEYWYVDKKLSFGKICDIFAVSGYIMRKWMDDYSIKRRTRKESILNGYRIHGRKNLLDDVGYQKKMAKSRKYSHISKDEQKIFDFIKSVYSGEVTQTYRKDGVEYDIYVNEKRVAIEYNGLYWHSELKKDKNAHKAKTDHATENGIHLLHIWEDDWHNKQDVVKRKIAYLLNGSEKRIFGRKCQITKLSGNEAGEIYDFNHIQGKANATLHYGLKYDNELAAAMSFTKKKDDWELVRFCTTCSVIGGFSKLVKHFLKFNEVKSELYSFGDLGIVNPLNNVYKNNGWVEKYYLKPDYKYIVNGERHHKFKFRHKNLENKLKDYDPDLTEYENCTNHKIYRIWDAGKIKYTYPI